MRLIMLAIAPMLLQGSPTFAEDIPAPQMTPTFVEETPISGVESTFTGDWQYIVGGGVATFDCNDDLYPDMLLAGGALPAKFFQNRAARGGILQFTEEESGLELERVVGAYPLDIDSDGMMDLVLLRVGENVVMRGIGDCQFERANEQWEFNGGDAWWTAFSATWEKGMTWPTMAFGSYIDPALEINPWGSCTDNWLLRPNPNSAGFAGPTVLKPSYCSLSMLFTDWNLSGTPSLRVSNDREYYLGGTEQLWHIPPSMPPTLYTADEGWKPLKIWGMGIASSDVNGDGYPDYFLSSMADNKLQTIASPPDGGVAVASFKDIAFPLNAIAQRPYVGDDIRPSTAWHAQFEDVNNDGLPDLFIAKGNVADMPDFAVEDPNNLLLAGADGKYTEVGDVAGISSVAAGRGASLPDFNLDGLPDLVVVNRNSPAQIWRNTTVGGGNWVNVLLKQAEPNRDAIGAWIEVRAGEIVTRQEITVGGGHVSGQSTWRHFGMDMLTDAEVTVIWPDGTKTTPVPLDAGHFYILERGMPAVHWVPPPTAGG